MTADSISGAQADVDNDEAARIAQMFAQSDQQWEQQQDQMATCVVQSISCMTFIDNHAFAFLSYVARSE